MFEIDINAAGNTVTQFFNKTHVLIQYNKCLHFIIAIWTSFGLLTNKGWGFLCNLSLKHEIFPMLFQRCYRMCRKEGLVSQNSVSSYQHSKNTFAGGELD